MKKQNTGQRNRLVIAVLLSPVMGVLCLPSQAQVLEEVIVVARKRVENLQDTPVAVTAFGSQDMRDAQINNLADLSRQVPGLTNTDGAIFANGQPDYRLYRPVG